ncbi:uncharacterized protein LOC8268831 [Ricinus communis]|uniref:Uncharacterized protein n=1 Tax=Ricinus communis TaxID=3988 RepID=B9SB98_RICCO|nr:uncharacterized protein LOC8268831 [Ricinus communis]EEF39106.1 conserved hypothetical protein [Ricinus communis]|eukprot:XP_002523267.1 uncharacterized protein LOC8268831 [Ricinus communis]
MDPSDEDPFEPASCSSTKDDEKLENVHDLLEEGWFFGELLTSKPRMLRCYSDPSPNFDQGLLAENPIYIQKSSSSSKKVSGTLIRAPSLPPRLESREETLEEKESSSSRSKGMSKLIRQLSDQSLVQETNCKPTCIGKIGSIQEKESHNRKSKMMTGKPSKQRLLRTPSLPPCIGREEVIGQNDDESDITMSRLIRQAMPYSTEVLPPRHTPKGMIQDYNMPKYKPPRNWKDLGCTNPNQKVTKKSQSDLESQEVQGFKDLGFTFNKQDLDPSVVGILPGLQQDNKRQDQDQKDEVKRPYLSEAWHVQSCAPPIPLWATKNSAEDMKVQLKYWARAVASNVR